MRRAFSLVFLFMLPLIAEAKKAEPVTIRLHAEGNPKDGDTFTTRITLLNPPKEIVISKVPLVTERDIVSFYAFPAPDGSIGAYFRLDADGTHKLEQHSAAFRDTLVVALINGRVACAMMVDKKITDGVMLVASGLLPIEVAQLQTKFPVIGKEKQFAEQKKKATALLKEAMKNQPKAEPTPKK